MNAAKGGKTETSELITPIKSLGELSTLLCLDQQNDAIPPKVVIVDLYKRWCGPCLVMEPTFHKLLDEINDPENPEGKVPTKTGSLPLRVVTIAVEDMSSWFQTGSGEKGTGDDSETKRTTDSATLDDGKTAVPTHQTLFELFPKIEVEKIQLLLEEEADTCKPLFLFLKPIVGSEGSGTSGQTQAPSGGVGNNSRGTVTPVVSHIVHGADAPRILTTTNSMIQEAE